MSPETHQQLIGPKHELDSHQQFLESYTSIVKIYQELVPLDKRLEGHEKRLQEIKVELEAMPQKTKDEIKELAMGRQGKANERQMLIQELLAILSQVDRAHELHQRLDRIPEEIRKVRGKDTAAVELSVLDNEITPLVEAEKFKAEFHRDKSQMPIERRIADDATEAIKRASGLIEELRAEVSGSFGIDDLIKQHGLK
jgi:hypothetical protein